MTLTDFENEFRELKAAQNIAKTDIASLGIRIRELEIAHDNLARLHDSVARLERILLNHMDAAVAIPKRETSASAKPRRRQSA